MFDILSWTYRQIAQWQTDIFLLRLFKITLLIILPSIAISGILLYAIDIVRGFIYLIQNWGTLQEEGIIMTTLVSSPILPAFLFVIVCFGIFVIVSIISFAQWKNKIVVSKLPKHLQDLQDSYTELGRDIKNLSGRVGALEDKDNKK